MTANAVATVDRLRQRTISNVRSPTPQPRYRTTPYLLFIFKKFVPKHPSQLRSNKINSVNGICRTCGNKFAAEPKRTFLGFQKLKCPSCKEDVIYPLTRSYRIAYWVIFSLMVLIIAGTFAQGEIGFPGGLGIAVLIALYRDWAIQRRVSNATMPNISDQI